MINRVHREPLCIAVFTLSFLFAYPRGFVMIIIRSCCNYFCALLLFDTFQRPFWRKEKEWPGVFKKVFPKDPMITDISPMMLVILPRLIYINSLEVLLRSLFLPALEFHPSTLWQEEQKQMTKVALNL